MEEDDEDEDEPLASILTTEGVTILTTSCGVRGPSLAPELLEVDPEL
jgi:hypothetical protein